MTVRQAQAEGLSFAGCWVRDYERVEARETARHIREDLKCRAVLVNEEGGVAVYAEEKYFELQRLNDLKCRLMYCPAKRKKILEQLAELDEEERRIAEKISEIESKYGIGEEKANEKQ